MKRWLWRPWLIVSVVLSMGGLVLAGFTGIDPEPDPPIVVGNWYRYNAGEDNNGWADDYNWDYQCLEGGAGAWNPRPGDSTATASIEYSEPYVGAYNLRVRAYYHTGEDPPEGYNDEEITSVTVLGPNLDYIKSGLNTDSSGYPMMWLMDVVFQPAYNSVDIGEEAVVVKVQERVVRAGWDSGWFDGDQDFYYDDAAIHDNKFVNAQAFPGWGDIPVGAYFDYFTQTARIVIRNCAYQDVTFTLTTHSLKKKKTSQTTWRLEQN